MKLTSEVREVIQSGRLAHLVTLNRDGSPQVSCVWVDVDGGEIVSAHLFEQQKLRNVRRDPRVSLSIEAANPEKRDLQPYLVVHGRGRITEGGAPELLNLLGRRYLGRDDFPTMADPPAGFVLRIEVERVGGIGPWAPR
jgi:PPOX class probable F420-dependent enzyme